MPGTRTIAVTLALLLQAGAAIACPLDLPVTAITVGAERLTVEVAATGAARTCGLSRRPELAPDRGMLFVYPSARPMSFWMNETYVPLSIAFVDDEGRITSIQDMTPLQRAPTYDSPGPARLALEVPQGWFAARGIEVGDRVALDPKPGE